jgi:hypothetical protein
LAGDVSIMQAEFSDWRPAVCRLAGHRSEISSVLSAASGAAFAHSILNEITRSGFQMASLVQVNFGDVVRVWQRNYDVYIQLWRTEIIAPLFEPFFTVIGFGWGVGALIAGRVQGVPYLTFVGASILSFTALLCAIFECTYGSYFRMVCQSTSDAVLCTPVEVESLGPGEILWGASKALLDVFFCAGDAGAGGRDSFALGRADSAGADARRGVGRGAGAGGDFTHSRD